MLLIRRKSFSTTGILRLRGRLILDSLLEVQEPLRRLLVRPQVPVLGLAEMERGRMTSLIAQLDLMTCASAVHLQDAVDQLDLREDLQVVLQVDEGHKAALLVELVRARQLR